VDLAPFGYNGTCDTKWFNFWIKEKLLPELKQGQIVIMDNASIHKSDETRHLIESVGCKLIFLPPYSPDLNPIEHFLAKLKKVLRYTMHKFESFQDAILAAFS
jgi:transposase